MIKEIERFTETLSPDLFAASDLRDIGLFAVVDLDADNRPVYGSYVSTIVGKKERDNEFIEKYNLVEREFYSACIDANKYLDTGGNNFKKIHSSIPYALWFKRGNVEFLSERLPYYFNNCLEVNKDDEKIIEDISIIREFTIHNLINLLKGDPCFTNIKEKEYVKVFFLRSLLKYKDAFNNYNSKKALNRGADISGEGSSTFFAGEPGKKPFIVPKSAFIDVFCRVPSSMAEKLNDFKKMLSAKPKKLPNPLPVFINNEELNSAVVRLYTREKVINYRDIIASLYKKHANDIGNYYLIYWSNTKNGPVIFDFDYVEHFDYELDRWQIIDILQYEPGRNKIVIENIFALESEVFQVIFDRQLFAGNDQKGLTSLYFNKIKSRIDNEVNYQNLLKYRKNVFDYVYKSDKKAFTAPMLYDTIMSSILKSINSKSVFAGTGVIKHKLNILFSLYNNFINTNSNTGEILMPSAIITYQENLRKLLNEENYHLTDNDGEFAFAAGQLIYYIISKSKSENKTHALLEPFITKNDPVQFRVAITRGIDQYKHALNFGSKRFEKAASEVLAYDLTRPVKEILPVLLAGYFCSNYFYEKKINN